MKLKLSNGVLERPHFIIVYGVPGIGKTTFASDSPNPVIIDIEDGSANIDVTRVESDQIKTFSDLLNAMIELGRSDFSTIVIDSLSKVEELIWDATCARKSKNGKKYESIEDFGYKQGYIFCLDEWKEFINLCQRLRTNGKNVILIGHNMAKNFDDPTMAEKYARYEIDVHAKASGLLRKYVDAILFANYKTLVKDGKGLETGKRLIYTERRPGHDAKNRFCLPYEIDFTWADYTRAKANSKEDPETYKKQIKEMVNEIESEETRDKVLKAIEEKLSIAQLKSYVERVEVLIGAQGE